MLVDLAGDRELPSIPDQLVGISVPLIALQGENDAFTRPVDLERIREGEYGYCDSCGVEIGLKRLEARPTATLCIDCKTLEEMRERQVAK